MQVGWMFYDFNFQMILMLMHYQYKKVILYCESVKKIFLVQIQNNYCKNQNNLSYMINYSTTVWMFYVKVVTKGGNWITNICKERDSI